MCPAISSCQRDSPERPDGFPGDDTGHRLDRSPRFGSCRRRIHRENGGGPGLRLRQRRRLRFPWRLHCACAFLLSAHHPRHYLGQFDSRTPVEQVCRLCGITKRAHDVAWTYKGRVIINVISPIESNLGECYRHEFFNRMGGPRSNNEVVGLIALKHFPHRLDVVGSPAPIAADRQIAETKPLSAARTNPGRRRGDLAGHEAAWPKW